MLLLGTKNIGTQTVLADGILNLGQTYRRYCKKNSCGFPTFNFASSSISLQSEGIYHVTATIIFTGTVDGDYTFQLFENGVAIPGAIATETITTATTEFRTAVIDYYILADKDCILGVSTTPVESLTIVNVSDDTATVTNVVVNIDKVV